MRFWTFFAQCTLEKMCFSFAEKSKDFGYLVETGFISKTFSKYEIKSRIKIHPFLLNANSKNNDFLTLS